LLQDNQEEEDEEEDGDGDGECACGGQEDAPCWKCAPSTSTSKFTTSIAAAAAPDSHVPSSVAKMSTAAAGENIDEIVQVTESDVWGSSVINVEFQTTISLQLII
jgi:hypothetical protein